MAIKEYSIPLQPIPQSFSIALAGATYQLTVKWSSAAGGGWYMDIQRAGNAEPIIMGLPLVTGCDLLEPFHYLNFGGALILDSEIPASIDNLGIGQQLIFMVNDDATE